MSADKQKIKSFFFFEVINVILFVSNIFSIQIMKITVTQARRNAFVISVIHRSMNDMLLYYKRKMCPFSHNINNNKTLNAIKWPGSKFN